MTTTYIAIITHIIDAVIWCTAFGIHCTEKQKSFGETMCGQSLLLLAWEFVTLCLALTAAVVFVKRLAREIEES